MKLILDSCVFIDSFDPDSPNHSASLELLELLRAKEVLVTMPAHGWFEVQCTLQRLTNQNKFVAPRIQGAMNYPIELIHIDKEFILKYAMTDIPYTKAADHMFIAVAKINNWDLITSDGKMYDISKSLNIDVFKPKEFLSWAANHA